MKSNIRIIAGKWRSRKVSFLAKDQLRPTPDRVRETLFNWLAPYLVDAVCLDLYAGSGVLGFEALSRGAKSVTAIERDEDNIAVIEENAVALAAEGYSVVHADCLQWLQETSVPADILFVDPPYKKNLLAQTFAALEENHWVKTGSVIYFELDTPLDADLLPNNWKICKESKAGKVRYYLAKKEV